MTHLSFTRSSPACFSFNSSLKSAAGFTLVEVLVALLVLSIGLLGVAALQTQSLRLSADSFNLTQSQLLIDDLTERMRSNWNDGNALTSYEAQFDNADATDCEMDSFGQSEAELTNELSCWLEQVNTTLGSDFAPTFTTFAAGNAKERYADMPAVAAAAAAQRYVQIIT